MCRSKHSPFQPKNVIVQFLNFLCVANAVKNSLQLFLDLFFEKLSMPCGSENELGSRYCNHAEVSNT